MKLTLWFVRLYANMSCVLMFIVFIIFAVIVSNVLLYNLKSPSSYFYFVFAMVDIINN